MLKPICKLILPEKSILQPSQPCTHSQKFFYGYISSDGFIQFSRYLGLYHLVLTWAPKLLLLLVVFPPVPPLLLLSLRSPPPATLPPLPPAPLLASDWRNWLMLPPLVDCNCCGWVLLLFCCCRPPIAQSFAERAAIEKKTKIICREKRS